MKTQIRVLVYGEVKDVKDITCQEDGELYEVCTTDGNQWFAETDDLELIIAREKSLSEETSTN